MDVKNNEMLPKFSVKTSVEVWQVFQSNWETPVKLSYHTWILIKNYNTVTDITHMSIHRVGGKLIWKFLEGTY